MDNPGDWLSGVFTLIVAQLIGVSEHEETLATDVPFLDQLT